MATNYPGGYDNWLNPSPTTAEDDAGYEHDLAHSNTYDAIEAIETELGLNPRGAYASVAARLSALAAPAPTIDLPLDSLTGWTIEDGTWTINGGVLELSTSGNSVQRVLRLDQRIGTAIAVVEVEINVVSGSGSYQRASVGIAEPANFSNNFPVAHVMMSNDSGVTWTVSADAQDVTARGAATVNGITPGYNTWHTARVVFVGDNATISLDGILQGNFTKLNGTANAQENRYFSLGGMNSVSQFRNLKIWDTATIISSIIGV